MAENKKTGSLVYTDGFLEKKKNELLLSFYDRDDQKALLSLEKILFHACQSKKPDENSLKLLTQIHLLTQKLSNRLSPESTILVKEKSRQIKRVIVSSLKENKSRPARVSPDQWEEKTGLSANQKKLLWKSLMTFQLTTGCSNFCRRCNEWALPGVRAHFSFDAVKKIIDCIKKEGNTRISLYGASDPLDWQETKSAQGISGTDEPHKDILDIISHLNLRHVDYDILTKVPRGKLPVLKKLISCHADFSISITSKNKSRISKVEKQLKTTVSRQHDTEDLLIPAGLDENFTSVKASITDGYGCEITPDGAFIIIPTFTSALHPFGHKKIPVTSSTRFFPVKKTGRQALLVDYFKPLKGCNLNSEAVCLDDLLDVQVESIILDSGDLNLVPPGMRNLKEYFEIFDELPRLKRKKINKTVLKHLKKKFLKGTSFQSLSDNEKLIYSEKVRAHIVSCSREECLQMRLFSAAFLLNAVRVYVRKNSLKSGILQYLLRNEIKHSFSGLFPERHEIDPEAAFTEPNETFYPFFRHCIFILLREPENKNILAFLKKWPPAYHPARDQFVSAETCSYGL